MGSATSKKSLLSKKVIILVVSLILTGIVMRVLSPAKKLDSRLYYTYEQATLYLEGLTEIEKQNYFYGELFDFWFMVNYSWLLFLAFRKFVPNKKYLVVAFAPGILDLFETGLITHYLNSREFNSAYQFLPAISFFKWLLGFLILLSLGRKIIFWRRANY